MTAGGQAQEGPTPRQILIGWANEQDAWARRLAGEVLTTSAAPAVSDIEALYEVFKAEKGFQTDPPFQTPPLAGVGDEAAVEDELVLLGMAAVRGVNALTDTGSIHFNEGLTLLFGENGSGKTGYARVLKRLADVRTAEPILGNAHAVVDQPSPSATLRYRLGEAETVLGWSNEAGVAPFTRMTVFDQRAVLLHVDDDLTYIYTPADLAFFTHVASGIRGVQELLAAEVAELRPAGNPFIARFNRQSSLFPIIETLGATSDLAQLRALAEVPPDAQELRQTLNEEIAALKGTQLEDRQLAFKQRIKAMASLRSILEVAARFNPETYRAANHASRAARAALTQARESLFEGVDLPGPPDAEWEGFVGAAEAYRQHLGLENYPSAHDLCLYCRQELGPDALLLLGRYQRYLDGALREQVREADRVLVSSALRLDEQALSEAESLLEMWAGAEKKPDWLAPATSAVAYARRVSAVTAATQPLEAESLHDLQEVLNGLALSQERTTSALKELGIQRASRQQALSDRQTRLVELEAKLELAAQLAAIESHVGRVQRGTRLEALGKRISNSTLKSLTEAAKVASEELVNQNFERCFSEESAALRVPEVKLHFQGRGGKPERKKVVARHRPSDILSEGEIKVLALADFLAECRLRGTRAPIVFDDPVTSLDYRRLREVAGRIASLARTHQVVVFTHNIMLATTLLALFEADKTQCTYYSVRDREELKGFLSAESGPRQDTPAELTKRINKTIDAAAAAEGEVQESLIERGYDLVRSWCEAFVEQELLGGVIRRFEPNVSMTKLPAVKTAFIPGAIEVIDPLFLKACRVMGGHSQPLEQLSVRPSLAELRQDFDALKAVRAAWLGTPNPAKGT